jgi:hypothetical protein
MRLISVVLSAVLLSIGLVRSQTIHPSAKRAPVTSEPILLGLYMTPQVDALFAGDMFIFHAGVKDDTDGVRHEFDSEILWTLSPKGTTSTLTGTTGSVDTFFARQAYTSYIIGVSWTNDSVVPPKTLTVFDTVYVKPEPSDLARFSATKVLDRTKPVCEYYTLRGQKLHGFGNSRVNGIVLERMIGPDGTSSAKTAVVGAVPGLRIRNVQ